MPALTAPLSFVQSLLKVSSSDSFCRLGRGRLWREIRQEAHATHSVKREDEIRYWYHRTPRARLDLRVDGERVVLARYRLGIEGNRSSRRHDATAKLVIA
jgi:hypothetical protein